MILKPSTLTFTPPPPGRDGAGMDEQEDIDVRMFEKGEDRLTGKQRQKRQVRAG